MKKKKLKQKIVDLNNTIVSLYRNIDILCGDDQDAKAEIMMDRRLSHELSDYFFDKMKDKDE